jgi:5-methyltetrahydrofolate--homocysteine methyltransferase
MDVLSQLAEILEAGEDERVGILTDDALGEGRPPAEILAHLIARMRLVGERFERREIFLPDMLLAARAMYAALDRLRPHLVREGVKPLGRVVLGTVHGDLHDIGKNLVGIMLRGAGFEVLDLGHDVAPEAFVDAAIEREIPLIGMSALLTTTMGGMRDVVELLRKRDASGAVRTLVGGAPVSAEFAREIGADAYACDAAAAVQMARELLGVG